MRKRKKQICTQSEHDSAESRISTASIQSIIEKLKQERVRATTKRNYLSVWKNFNKFFIKLDIKPSSWEDRIMLFAGHLINQEKRSQTVRSYISAIKGILRDDGVQINEDKFLLHSLTRACKLKNDQVRARLPIQKGLLKIIIRTTREYFMEKGQPYLAILYATLFSTAYFGMFRVGELATGDHPIKVTDVQMAENKYKIMFILRTSKTHGRDSKPKQLRSAEQMERSRNCARTPA